jgi:hypothetical protein
VDRVGQRVEWYRIRRQRKQEESELRQKLNIIKRSTADAYRRFILKSQLASEEVCLVLARTPALLEHDILTTWRIPGEHKQFLKKWARGTVADK